MANTYSQLYFHIVFAVKGRENLISKEWKNELYKYICGIEMARGIWCIYCRKARSGDNHILHKNQEKHHVKKKFAKEYIELLVKHEIEFEEKYTFR